MPTKNTLRACVSIFHIRLAEGFQYRTAALSGTIVGVFWGLVEVLIFTIFYTYGSNYTNNAGITLSQVISYAWLNQVLFGIQPMSVDSDILQKITSGDVGVELCRPLDLYSHWFAKTMASRLTPFLFRGGLTMIVAFLMPVGWRLSPPASVAGLALFLLSLCSAIMLCSAYGMLVNAIRVNITWGEGPTYMILFVGGVLSGGYFPLQLWPAFMQRFLLLQPFAGYMDIPVRLYIGSMPISDAGWALALQWGWALSFIIVGKWVLRRKCERIIIQGG